MSKSNNAKPAAFHNVKPKMPPTPPGLVGQITRFVSRRLQFKMPNIALAAALSAVSRMNNHQAIVVAPNGRQTPLNLYTLLTAQSGAGKETVRTFLNDLGHAIAKEPLISNSPASPQALGRMLSKQSGTSLLLYIDEYGKRLSYANSGSGAHDNAVHALLLELFGLPLGTYSGKTYAKEKDDVKCANLPCVSLLAATTIEPLAAALNDASIYDGTLNRFLYLPQPDKLVRNSNPAFGDIPPQIIKPCRQLWQGSSTGAALGNADAIQEAPNTTKIHDYLFRAIHMTDDAFVLLDEFDRSLDVIKEGGGPRGLLAARATELVVRVSGVVALGCANDLNHMTLERLHIEYGIALIRYSMDKMLEFVDEELVDADPRNLTRKILEFCRECVEKPEEAKIPKGRERWREINRNGCVMKGQITRKFQRVRRRDREDAIHTLVEAGELLVEELGVAGQKVTMLRPTARDAA
jgi:hypothetical protein